MKNISIKVRDKRAIVEGSPVIVCGNSDYTLTFTFDEEWSQSGIKTARFVYARAGKVMHEDKVFEGNTVAVPVLSGVDFVNVGVFEGDLCTTTPARIACKQSILCGSGAPHDPTPDVYNQIMELFNELAERGSFGATEEQAQQIAQNKQNIENLENGTTKAGDANKLGGHAAEYFATDQSVKNLEDGTTKAGDANKLGGHEPSYFTPKADLANYLPKSGGTVNGKVSVESDDLPRFELNNGTSHGWLVANSVYLGFYNNITQNWVFTSHTNGTNEFRGTATGNLPLSGGGTVNGHITLDRGTAVASYKTNRTQSDGSVYGAQMWTGTDKSALFALYNIDTNTEVTRLDLRENDIKVRLNGASKEVLHTGNSAKVHIGTTAPDDTTALWIDTN